MATPPAHSGRDRAWPSSLTISALTWEPYWEPSRCGLPWKVVDRYRASDVSDQADWTLMDAHVRRLEIYGSGRVGVQVAPDAPGETPAQTTAGSRRFAVHSDRAERSAPKVVE